jgi:hypothetical protein
METTSKALQELLPDLRTWDAEFSEFEPVPVDRLSITEAGLIFDRNSIPVDRDARLRLFAKAGAPVSYLANRSIDIQTIALREHMEQGDFGKSIMPVLRGGQLFTFMSGRLATMTNSEVVIAVAESLGNNADGLTMSKIDYADGRLELDLVSPQKQAEVRRGDVVQAGLHIFHSRYGGEATQICAFNYRLICENGMTRRECVSSDGIVRTRKQPASHPRAKELLLDQVRRLTRRTWDKLDGQLTELRATTERRADVPHLLRQWLQRARISTRTTGRGGDSTITVMDRLLSAWRAEGAEGNHFAAVNALTRVGTHDLDLSARQRRVLTLLGGLLAFSGTHICPRCFSVLSGPVGARADQTAEAA